MTNLEYTVHYYLEGTTTKVKEDKVVTGQVFDTEVTESPVDVAGYYIVDNSPKTIKIAADKPNEIIFYYGQKNSITLRAIGGSAQYSAEQYSVQGYYVVVQERESLLERVADFVSNLFGFVVGAKDVSERTGSNEFTLGGKTYVVTGVTAGAQGTNAGSYPTSFTGTAKITSGGEDVTSKFDIAYENASLEISRRNITFTSASQSRQYNGSPLTNSNVSISGDGFVGNDRAEFTVTGSITNVGSTPNSFTYRIISTGDNYNVTKVEGTLTITGVPGGPTPPPTPPTPPDIPDEPTPTAPAAPAQAVLGARREEPTSGQAVLGARRARTEDTTNSTARVFSILVAAAAVLTLILTGKKKEEEEES